MRLQFRVWDKYKKEMLYHGFVVRCNNPYPEEDYEYMEYEAEPLEELDDYQSFNIRSIMGDLTATYSLIDWSNFYGQENYVTMQATGMHDKNGQLIWEGDILEWNGIKDVVSWHYSCFIWNGQMIADFREFDRYGKEVKQNTDLVEIGDYVGVAALGYQGDVYGLQTENLTKIGNIYENPSIIN